MLYRYLKSLVIKSPEEKGKNQPYLEDTRSPLSRSNNVRNAGGTSWPVQKSTAVERLSFWGSLLLQSLSASRHQVGSSFVSCHFMSPKEKASQFQNVHVIAHKIGVHLYMTCTSTQLFVAFRRCKAIASGTAATGSNARLHMAPAGGRVLY